jgi:hypothetical protein
VHFIILFFGTKRGAQFDLSNLPNVAAGRADLSPLWLSENIFCRKIGRTGRRGKGVQMSQAPGENGFSFGRASLRRKRRHIGWLAPAEATPALPRSRGGRDRQGKAGASFSARYGVCLCGRAGKIGASGREWRKRAASDSIRSVAVARASGVRGARRAFGSTQMRARQSGFALNR